MDIAYDPSRSRILVSTGSGDNSIRSVNPISAEQQLVASLPFEPNKIALSDDGAFLYVAEFSGKRLFRVNLASSTLDAGFAITMPDSPQFIAELIAPVGQADVIVTADHYRATAFANSLPLPLTVSGLSLLAHGEQPNVLYQVTQYSILVRLEVRSDGLHVLKTTEIPRDATLVPFSSSGNQLLFSSGHLYDGPTGSLVATMDPAALRISGRMPIRRSSLIDGANDRFLFLVSPTDAFSAPGAVLRSFSSRSLTESWAVVVPGIDQYPTRFILTTPGRAAFAVEPSCHSCPSRYLTLLDLSAIPAQPSADLQVTTSLSVSNVMVGRRTILRTAVYNDGPWRATGVQLECRVPEGLRFEYPTNNNYRATVTFAEGMVRASFNDIVSFDSVTLDLVFTVVGPGEQIVGTTVKHDGQDPFPQNNQSSPTLHSVAVPTISIHDGVITEGATTRTGPLITLSHPIPENIEYSLLGRSGTATMFEDGGAGNSDARTFFSANTVPRGQTSVVARLIVYDDQQIEAPETLFLKLSVPSIFIVGRDEAMVTILDNDFPTLSVSPGTARETHAGETNFLRFEVRYSPAIDAPLVVRFHTRPESAVPGVDYFPISGRLDFPAGISNLFVDIPIFGDDAPEPDESFLLVLENPEGLLLPPDPSARGVILDNDRLAPIAIRGVRFDQQLLVLTFDSVPGTRYQLEFKLHWTANWSAASDPVTASATAASLVHPVDLSQHPIGFFRVVAAP